MMVRHPSSADLDSDETKEGTDVHKTKRTRNRRPASCMQCRSKKMRCDRLQPCEACRLKGEPELCTYAEGSAPLHVPQGNGDAAELKAQVDRLQKLVDTLARNASSLSANLTSTTPSSVPLGSRAPSPVHAGDSSAHNAPQSDLGKLNLKNLDICEALGQLTVSGVVRLDGSQPYNVPLMSEARAVLGQTSPPDEKPNLGTFPFSSTPDSIDKIMDVLPSLSQAETVITCFKKQLSWYISFFPWTSFNAQWIKLQKATTANVDCSFLGIFLAVCGTGLYFLPEKIATDFPPDVDRRALAKSWFNSAASALTLARFLDCPSLNSIHAMQLLTAWHIYLAPGDTSSTGFAILNIAAEAVLQLGLHRDPDPACHTPFEANVKRLTYWNTVMLETHAGASLGKTWSLFQLKRSDTKLPLNISEKAFLPGGYLRPDWTEKDEPDMTSILLRMRIAIVSKQISERAFSIEDVSFSTVLELDRELHQLEDSFPEHYRIDFENGKLKMMPGISRLARLRAQMVNIGLLQEYMRLHRPFVASGSAYGVCRTTCLKSARIMLGIYQELAAFNYGGLTFKAVSACCVICMDLMSNPSSTYAKDMRQEVKLTLDLLDGNKKASKLATNGAALVHFLLAKSAPPSDKAFQRSSPNQDLQKRRRHDSLLTEQGYPQPAARPHDSVSAASRARVNVIPSTATEATFEVPSALRAPSQPHSSPNLLQATYQPQRPSPPAHQRPWSGSASHHSAPDMGHSYQTFEVPGYYTPPLHSNPSLYAGSSYMDAAVTAPASEQFTYVSPTASVAGAATLPLTPQEPDWGKHYNQYDDAFQAYTGSSSSEDWTGARWPPQ